MPLDKDQILHFATQTERLTTSALVKKSGFSRQYVSSLISELVEEGKLIKLGSTRKAFYVLPQYASKYQTGLKYHKIYKNIGLEEHKVIDQIEQALALPAKLPENIYSIFFYAFSEMVNNAIEHSSSPTISVEVNLQDKLLTFTVNDSGIGIFRNIMQKKHLNSELEAIQELMKGKTTTMPKSHSGEGIFFTSKAGDIFILDSFGYELIVDNTIPDIFVNKTKKIKRGTRVIFKINTASSQHLTEIFNQFANLSEESDYGFDKTQIHIKLYTIGGIHISRSQARRVLAGLEKFNIILFDFDKVPMVGQAFADEIYRVFHRKYPHIKLEETNMNDAVKFMIERAKHEAKK